MERMAADTPCFPVYDPNFGPNGASAVTTLALRESVKVRFWPTVVFAKDFGNVRFQSQEAIHNRLFKGSFWPTCILH